MQTIWLWTTIQRNCETFSIKQSWAANPSSQAATQRAHFLFQQGSVPFQMRIMIPDWFKMYSTLSLSAKDSVDLSIISLRVYTFTIHPELQFSSMCKLWVWLNIGQFFYGFLMGDLLITLIIIKNVHCLLIVTTHHPCHTAQSAYGSNCPHYWHDSQCIYCVLHWNSVSTYEIYRWYKNLVNKKQPSL